MVICEHCNKTLKSEKYLKRHLRNAKYCRNSRNIIVFCRMCKSAISLKDLDTHSDTCKGPLEGDDDSDDWKVKMFEVAQENNTQKTRCRELEEKIEKQNTHIYSLMAEMKWLRLQSNIYAQLIRTNTDIPIDDIIESANDGIHIYNYKDGNLPIVVHQTIKGKKGKCKKYTIPISKKPKKQIYRTVKNQAELVVEEDREEKVKQVDETLEEIVHENFDVSRDTIISEIDGLLSAVETSRIYKKNLKAICSVRSQLLGILNLEEYTELLKTHKERLEEIFTSKQIRGKKLKSTLTKTLTPLDARLIFYNGYYNSSVTLDDCERLKLALDVTTVHPKEYRPFSKEDTYNQLRNYSIALFPLKECLKRVLINRYDFHNLIYFPLRKSTGEDPFSFYTLLKIDDKGMRLWKMEGRLEDFCVDFVNGVRSYCVFLFRKIYFDIFGDNEYREDFAQHCQIMHEDCEQLLQNISAMSYPVSFRDTMKQFVIENATVQPTEIDKCNLRGDDRLQQRRLKNEKESDEESMTVAKQLFDGITNQQALGMWGDR